MAAFTSAGIPIVDAIEMLAKTSKNKNMKSTLYGVADEIRNGASLSTAVGMYPKVFPKFYIAILEASDRSGDIAITFQNLTAYIERDYTSKRTIKSALYYPAILLVIAILAIFILSIVVLPKFEVFFSSLNAKLPLPTRMLLNFSNFMQHDWWLVAAVIIGAIVAVWAYRKTPAGLFQTDALLLKLPIFGRVLEIISLERFTRVLGSLANAGVPLPEALELSSKVVSNEVYLRAINFVREGVIAGRGFIDPLEETKVFPEEIQQILRVGEQTGRLVEQLEFASQYYSKEVDYRLKNVSTLIEPIILVFVGGGVGFVAVALVSAMYGIYSSNALGQ
jgi:type IV pilus assembly protein PilC